MSQNQRIVTQQKAYSSKIVVWRSPSCQTGDDGLVLAHIGYFMVCLTICLMGNFSCFLSSADFFQNHLFRKILSGIPSECQKDWIQIRPNILSSLICIQYVCKGYEQTKLAGNEINYMNF